MVAKQKVLPIWGWVCLLCNCFELFSKRTIRSRAHRLPYSCMGNSSYYCRANHRVHCGPTTKIFLFSEFRFLWQYKLQINYPYLDFNVKNVQDVKVNRNWLNRKLYLKTFGWDVFENETFIDTVLATKHDFREPIFIVKLAHKNQQTSHQIYWKSLNVAVNYY